MQEVLTHDWGNPSSLHEWGQRSAFRVEQARLQVAQLINAPAESIIFTSGGTESDNLALQGIARIYAQPQHLMISSVEHPAVSQTASCLEDQGWEVTHIPVNSQGRIDPDEFRRAIQPNTVMASIIYGQSEVGTIQPIAELGQIAQKAGVIFHTDAVQAVGRVPIDVATLPIDLLSLSSHKLYGPQGVGALYVKPDTSLLPILGGGGQEKGLRSGTQNVVAIAGFGVAAEYALQELEREPQRLKQLCNRLIHQLTQIPQLKLTGDPYHRLPHHVSFCLDAPSGLILSGRSVVKQMNLAGIAISAGSACHSGTLQPSPVLLAMGYDPNLALSNCRITVGRATTEADVDWTAIVLHQVLERLMAESPAPDYALPSLALKQ